MNISVIYMVKIIKDRAFYNLISSHRLNFCRIICCTLTKLSLNDPKCNVDLCGFLKAFLNLSLTLWLYGTSSSWGFNHKSRPRDTATPSKPTLFEHTLVEIVFYLTRNFNKTCKTFDCNRSL